MSRLDPARIVVAEGRIGVLSIFDSRAEVERILGVERKSLWGARAEPAPAILLTITFESDEEVLYDSEEMLLHATELDDLWREDFGGSEESVEEGVRSRLELEEQRSMSAEDSAPTTDEIALRPEEDWIVDLALDWTRRAPGLQDLESPVVVFPDGSSASCADLRLEQMVDVLGPPPVAEDLGEFVLCEWPLDGFLVSADVKESGKVCGVGFSRLSILVSPEDKEMPS